LLGFKSQYFKSYRGLKAKDLRHNLQRSRGGISSLLKILSSLKCNYRASI